MPPTVLTFSTMQKHLATLTLICLSAFGFIPAVAQPVSRYTVTDFVGVTFFKQLEVSPDARHVAFITSKNNFATDRRESVIWKIDVDAQGRKTEMTSITNRPGEFSGLKWSADSRYLGFKSILANSKTQLVVFDTHSNKSFLVTSERKFKNGITAFDWSANGARIYFVIDDVTPPPESKPVSFPQPAEPDDHSTFYRLAVADLGRKEAQPFVSMADTASEFAISPDEKTIAFRPARALFLLDTTKKDSIRRLTPPFPCLDPGLKRTTNGILIQGCGGIKDGRMIRTQRRIYWVNPVDGHMEQLGADFTGELWAQDVTAEGGVLAIGNVSTKWGLYYIDAATRKAREVESALGPIQQISIAANGEVVAFVTMNNPELYIAGGINRLSNATKITDFNASFNKLPKPEIETIRWNNNDGDTIEGLLYFPPGQKGAKNLPLILDIHGGPWIARTESFYTPLGGAGIDGAALLATRGYLVLLPNYRGSTGRGDGFLQALNGYPCSRPATDVLSGVDYVIANGWADPKRLGVRGGSYGGRITNCVIGLTTRFKAAVSIAGFWNLTSAFSDSGGALAGFDSFKPPWEDMTRYWEESPISHAANIKTPTLIMIGGADTAVSPAQAREQKRAFDWLEVPSELLIFPGDVHELIKPSSTRTRLEAEVAWFDHYVLGKPLPKAK